MLALLILKINSNGNNTVYDPSYHCESVVDDSSYVEPQSCPPPSLSAAVRAQGIDFLWRR